MNFARPHVATMFFTIFASFATTFSASAAGIVWDGSKPPPGVLFHWYEPSFYAGFAPRTQDPSRVHIELSRGNQVRFTIVLGQEQIDAYLGDLLVRQDTYQELISKKIIVLTTNKNYERFNEQLAQHDVGALAEQRESLGAEAYRSKTLDVMNALNPGRVFSISIPFEKLAADWHAALAAMGQEDFKALDKRLDTANAILPGRINLYELDDKVGAELGKAFDLAHAGGAEDPAFRAQAASFLEIATNGHYVMRDDRVEATEFTAIYPAGTVAQWTKTPRGRLPDFGVTGVWPLMKREQGRGVTGMVDYLSSNPGYGFIPLLAYQHAGGIYYNAFHNAGIRSPVETSYLPKEWRKVPGERDSGKNYKQLWVVSRGPASHGCTRMDSGQMSELRHALPASSDVMSGLSTFRNLPQCYEVFDIDGDGSPEVMGVEYFLAYESQKHKPVKAFAPNAREPYYKWLYGDNISYNPDGSAVIKEVPVCRFLGKRKAVESQVYENVPLYEAPFKSEPIQFYQITKTSFETKAGFEFNRTLRQVGTGYEIDRSTLFLK